MKQKTESAGHCPGGCSLAAEQHLPYDTGQIDGVMGDTSEARDRPCLQVLLKQGSALETNTLTVLHQNLLWPGCAKRAPSRTQGEDHGPEGACGSGTSD